MPCGEYDPPRTWWHFGDREAIAGCYVGDFNHTTLDLREVTCSDCLRAMKDRKKVREILRKVLEHRKNRLAAVAAQLKEDIAEIEGSLRRIRWWKPRGR